MLAFYYGLEGWDFRSEPALYLMGYFDILAAGRPADFESREIGELFQNNFHVRHRMAFEKQRNELVLVRGSERSRLLRKPVKISVMSRDRSGKPLKVLSPEMQSVFGHFDGKLSFQRSPTRWVDPGFVRRTVDFIRRLD